MMNLNYKNYIFILGFSLAVSIGIQLILPHPFGIFTALGIFLAFPFLLRKMSAAKFGTSFTNKFGNYSAQEAKLSKTCMTCGKQTSNRTCGRCGSRSFRYS
jgi:uncharacterized paraquat-inducible protein A